MDGSLTPLGCENCKLNYPCCRELITVGPRRAVISNFLLLPDEKERFERLLEQHGKKAVILPRDRVGDRITTYQVATSPCPFFDLEAKKCSIYEQRFNYCKAYPFIYVRDLQPMPTHNCPWFWKHKTERQKDMLKPQMLNYVMTSKLIIETIAEQLEHDIDKPIYVYSLDTMKWVRVNDV